MKQLEMTIQNSVGLHTRPAALFVQTAQKYKAKIKVTCNNIVVNGKSLLGVLSLAAIKDTRISIEADGDDEENALNGLKSLVESNFNE